MNKDCAKTDIFVKDKDASDQSHGDNTDLSHGDNAESIYNSCGNSKAYVYLLSIGLSNDTGCPIIDINHHPWDEIKLKTSIQQKNCDFLNEIIQQQYWSWIHCHSLPTGKQMCSWIGSYNTQEQVMKTLSLFVEKWMSSMLEAKEYGTKLSYVNSRGSVPHLWLVDTIGEDDIKGRYLHPIFQTSTLISSHPLITLTNLSNTSLHQHCRK